MRDVSFAVKKNTDETLWQIAIAFGEERRITSLALKQHWSRGFERCTLFFTVAAITKGKAFRCKCSHKEAALMCGARCAAASDDIAEVIINGHGQQVRLIYQLRSRENRCPLRIGSSRTSPVDQWPAIN